MPVRAPGFFCAMSFVMFAADGCITTGRASFAKSAVAYQAIEVHAHDARAQDELALHSKQLDRGALVRAVLNRNPNVESALAAWRAALARYRQAGAYEDPVLKLSVAPLSFAANTRVGYEVGITQRLPLGGKQDAQALLAAAEAEAAQSAYGEVRVKLALTTTQLYADYFVAVRSLEIQAQHLELMRALQQSALAAYETGQAAAQDSLQAEGELARLEYQNSVFETDREIAIAQLNALLHREPEARLPPPPPELPLHDADETQAASELAKTVEHRPDIVSAHARVAVARARSAVAEADYYPDLMLMTSYNSMWDMPEHRWMAGVELSIPLQRERRHASRDEAVAMRSASQSEVQSMTDAARSEVSMAVRRGEQARRAVELYEQRLVPVAREQVEAARSGFATARNDFLSLIEAERNLRSAELELQVLRAELSKRRAELDGALGRLAGLRTNEVAP